MNINDKILTPTHENGWLVNYVDRILSQYVHLGVNGKVEDWQEISYEEKISLEKEWYE